ncbi:MAG: hypothetical protein C4583_13670 [Anaerolineaceae bacterium]|nr:MAG: hypothetical protein C4583_13670 [Anaerolineaceae bacterium]
MKGSSQIKFGIVLILFVAFLVAEKQFPAIREWVSTNTAYPLNIILVGIVIFVLSIWSGVTGCATIATLVAGVGGILYYQKVTGNSEPILWTLIPAFIGVGMIQSGLFSGVTQKAKVGTQLIGFSIMVFVICAVIFGRSQLLGGTYGLAIILIPLGVWYFVKGLRSKKNNQDTEI